MPSDKQLLESALLIVRWQRGDRAAFDGLIGIWEKPLFYYLRRLVRSEADAWELLQETWLRVLGSLNTLRDSCAFPAFLYTTARRTAFGRYRIRDHASVSLPEDLPDSFASDETALMEQAEAVHQALDQLPLPQREALTLYFLQDLSLDEIAALLGIPVGTVKSRLHYAKAALRTILSGADKHA